MTDYARLADEAINAPQQTTSSETMPLLGAAPSVSNKGRSLGKELASIAAGFILTWFIFWAYLSWDNFSSHYSADTLTNRFKAATLFVIQIMSLYFLAYGGLMYYLSRDRVYMWYIIIAVVFILIAILGTSLEWLST